MAAVSVHNDFGAQENKGCHSLRFPPMFLPLREGPLLQAPNL